MTIIEEMLASVGVVLMGMFVAHVVDLISASLAQRDLDNAEERRRRECR